VLSVSTQSTLRDGLKRLSQLRVRLERKLDVSVGRRSADVSDL
jgi:hypothetical protein